MTFIVGLVLAAIASFVTYASVMGVGSMFASTATPVMFAWTAVELGKYAAMSYTYRNYKDMSDQLKIAMSAFILFIMVLTSIGVYAYLGQSYSQVSTSVSKNEVAVKSIAGQLGQTKDRLAAIDRQVAEIPNTNTTARIRLIKQYDEERKPLADRQTALEAELAKLTTGTIEAETHVGIIKFLADSFGVSVERATMLAILAVTLCLDPFAMLLNVLFQRLMLQNAENRADYQRRLAAGEFKRVVPPPPVWWTAGRKAKAEEERIAADAQSASATRQFEEWMLEHKPNDWKTKEIRRRRGLWSDEEIRDRKIAAEVEANARKPLDNTDLNELLAEAIEATKAASPGRVLEHVAETLITLNDERAALEALEPESAPPRVYTAEELHKDLVADAAAVNSKIKPEFNEKQ